MDINIEDLDIEKLREDLKEHFMGAVFMVSPVAMMDVIDVENASAEELVKIAIANKFDISRYLL